MSALAFLTRERITKLPADQGAAAYLRGGFRQFHVITAEANEYNGVTRAGYHGRFDDELNWTLYGGFDELADAHIEATTITESSRANGPLSELRVVVWDSINERKEWDSRDH